MPDYIPYTSAEYEPEAPATALHFARWFQNWEAGFAGMPGAPGLALRALEQVDVGEAVRVRRDAVQAQSLANGQIMIGLSFDLMQRGNIRVALDHMTQSVAGTARIIRYRADVSTVIASWTSGSSYVARSADVPVLPGDQIRIESVGSNVTGNHYLRNCRIKTAGMNLFPGVYAPLENNYA